MGAQLLIPDCGLYRQTTNCFFGVLFFPVLMNNAWASQSLSVFIYPRNDILLYQQRCEGIAREVRGRMWSMTVYSVFQRLKGFLQRDHAYILLYSFKSIFILASQWSMMPESPSLLRDEVSYLTLQAFDFANSFLVALPVIERNFSYGTCVHKDTYQVF